MNSFALLSVRNSPLNIFLLNELENLNIFPDHIIFDKKNWSQKDLNRFYYRINEKVPNKQYLKNNSKTSFLDVENHNNLVTINYLKENKVNFLVNAGTPRILNQATINCTKLGILNCHPGILPYFKGCCCVEWAIYLDKPVGNSIHWMDQGIDTGPTIKTEITKCFINDTYQDVRKRVYFDGFKLLAKSIGELKKINFNSNLEYFKGHKNEGGNYYKPMDDNLLDEVKNKLKIGKYKYQLKK